MHFFVAAAFILVVAIVRQTQFNTMSDQIHIPGVFLSKEEGLQRCFWQEEGLWRQIYSFLWTDSCFSLATPGSHSTFGSKAPSELFESKKEVWVIMAEVVQANPSIVKPCLAQRLHKSSLSSHVRGMTSASKEQEWIKVIMDGFQFSIISIKKSLNIFGLVENSAVVWMTI